MPRQTLPQTYDRIPFSGSVKRNTLGIKILIYKWTQLSFMFPSNMCQMSHTWNLEAGIQAYQGGRAIEVYQSTVPASCPHPPAPHCPKSLVQAFGVERSQDTHPGHSCNYCKSRFLTSCSLGHFFLNVNFSPFFFFFLSGRVIKRLVDFKEKRQEEYKSISRIFKIW